MFCVCWVKIYRMIFQRSDRRSASERLFPVGQNQQSHTNVHVSSEEHVRRISDIYTPKPFFKSDSRSSSSGIRPVSSPLSGSHSSIHKPPSSVATVRPVVSHTTTASLRLGKENVPEKNNNTVTTATVKPMSSSILREKRPDAITHTPIERERRKTISGSTQLKMEKDSPIKKRRMHSVAGDLISSVCLLSVFYVLFGLNLFSGQQSCY